MAAFNIADDEEAKQFLSKVKEHKPRKAFSASEADISDAQIKTLGSRMKRIFRSSPEKEKDKKQTEHLDSISHFVNAVKSKTPKMLPQKSGGRRGSVMVSLTGEGAFDVDHLPDDWKELFKNLGVRKRELKDRETAKAIIEAVSNYF